MKRTTKTYTIGQQVMMHTDKASTLQTITEVTRATVTLNSGDTFTKRGDILGGKAPACTWIESLTDAQIAEIKGG